MMMTHYMGLLGMSPWHLILIMAVPMLVAEALIATEFFSLFYRYKTDSAWKRWNKGLGIFLVLYYIVLTLYILIAVLPTIHQWYGWLDYGSIGALILAVLPLIALLGLELNLWGKRKSEQEKLRVHVILLVIYLIIGHLAMIFGMANPGWTGEQTDMPMQHNGMMQQAPMNPDQMNHGTTDHSHMQDQHQTQHNTTPSDMDHSSMPNGNE
ncbi:DUF6803 family protein [Pasteurellaceae bacterium LIM206]|nr:DUF6803 family protein [Pasteurellaceae bacterium LIM206]